MVIRGGYFERRPLVSPATAVGSVDPILPAASAGWPESELLACPTLKNYWLTTEIEEMRMFHNPTVNGVPFSRQPPPSGIRAMAGLMPAEVAVPRILSSTNVPPAAWPIGAVRR